MSGGERKKKKLSHPIACVNGHQAGLRRPGPQTPRLLKGDMRTSLTLSGRPRPARRPCLRLQPRAALGPGRPFPSREPDQQGGQAPRPARPGPGDPGTGRKGAADLTTPSSGRGRSGGTGTHTGVETGRRARGCGPGSTARGATPNSKPVGAEGSARRPLPAPELGGGPGGRAGWTLTGTRAALGVSRTSRGGTQPARRRLPPPPRLPPRPGSARLSRCHVPTSCPPPARPPAPRLHSLGRESPPPATPGKAQAARLRGSQERALGQAGPAARALHAARRSPHVRGARLPLQLLLWDSARPPPPPLGAWRGAHDPIPAPPDACGLPWPQPMPISSRVLRYPHGPLPPPPHLYHQRVTSPGPGARSSGKGRVERALKNLRTWDPSPGPSPQRDSDSPQAPGSGRYV